MGWINQPSTRRNLWFHQNFEWDLIPTDPGPSKLRSSYIRYSGLHRGPDRAPWVRPLEISGTIWSQHRTSGTRDMGHPEIFAIRMMSRRLQSRWHFGTCCSFPWASWRNHRGHWHQRLVLEKQGGGYSRVWRCRKCGDICVGEKNVGKKPGVFRIFGEMMIGEVFILSKLSRWNVRWWWVVGAFNHIWVPFEVLHFCFCGHSQIRIKYDLTNMNFYGWSWLSAASDHFSLVDLGVFLARQLHLLQHFAVVPKNEGAHSPINYGGFLWILLNKTCLENNSVRLVGVYIVSSSFFAVQEPGVQRTVPPDLWLKS